jgi:hypothetical protein
MNKIKINILMDIKQLQVQQLMEKVINKLYNKNKNKILLKYKVFN